MDNWSNDALVTQSLVNSASFLLGNERDKKQFNLMHFFNFSALCEAVVLFDRLQTMESLDNLSEYYLSRVLTKHDIIKIFNPKFSHDEMQEIVEDMRFLLNDSSNSIELDWHEIKNDSINYYELWGRERHDICSPLHDINRPDLTSLILFNNDMGILSYLSTVRDAVEKMSDKKVDSDNFFEGSLHNRRWKDSYLLRSAAYVHMANISRIDYYPDSSRVPYIASYLNKMYTSLPKELYQRICNCLELDLKKIDSYTKSTTYSIPPFTAIVLNEARSLDEIPFTLLDLRSDFASFRKKLSKVDNVLKNPSSIDEKLKALNKKRSLLEQVSEDYKDKEIISFKEGLDYAKKVIEPIKKPTDPTSYSLSLISQPIEWLQEWWLRRPIYPLFRVDEKVRKITQYNKLISKHWGEKAQAKALNDYKNSYKNHSDIVKNIFEKV